MKRETARILCLVRHAAAGAAGDGTDIGRPLSREGRQQARRLAGKLAARKIKPDRIVASPADRTLETASALAEALGVNAGDIRIDERIYQTSANDELLNVVRGLDGGESVVILVGHQPVIGELALFLVPDFSGSFPRSGTACIGLDIAAWEEAGFGTGRLLWFETG